MSLALSIPTGVAQAATDPPTWFPVSAGGAGADDYGRGVAILPDGSAVVTGRFGGDATFSPAVGGGSLTLTSAGGADMFVARVNRDGQWVWATRAGGAGGDFGTDIKVHTDGTATVAGYFSDSATFTSTVSGTAITLSGVGFEVFVARVNANGQFEWATGVGSNGADIPWGLGLSSNGHAVITGQFDAPMTFTDTVSGTPVTLNPAGAGDVFVASINAQGQWVWATRAGGGGWDLGVGAAAGDDGSAVVTGWFSGSFTISGTASGVPITMTSAGGNDVFIGKVNADGLWLWATRAGGWGNDGGIAVSTGSDGATTVTGNFHWVADFSTTVSGTPINLSGTEGEMFTARINADGQWVWAVSAGGAGGDGGAGVSVLADGTAVVSGSFNGTATFADTVTGTPLTLTSAGASDAFVAKISSEGQWLWATSAGGSGGDAAIRISALSDGRAVVTGIFDGSATFGSRSLSGVSTEAFVARIRANGQWDAPPTQMASHAGNSQTATAGSAVVTAPSVVVRDAGNEPVPGVTVTFAIGSGGGSVTGATAVTDASGVATVGSWILGPTVGANTLTATSTGLTGSPVTFSATGSLGAAAAVVAFGAAAGSVPAGTATLAPPAVRVVDANGNGIPGATVTFTTTAGGGQVAPALIANLDAVYRTGGSTVVTNEAKAVLFTTGQGAVSVSRVAVMFNGPTSTYPASFQARVALHAVSAGNPAAVLAQSEVVSLTLANSRVWHVFTLPALTLAASQSYALVVSNPGGTGFRWANTDSSFAPSAFGGATYDGARFWNLTTSQWDSASSVNAFVLGADVTDATTIAVTTSSTGVAAIGRWTVGTTAGVNTVTAVHAVGSQAFSATGVAGAATQLVITTTPVAGTSGAAFTLQPSVAVRDAFGNTATGDSSTIVTLSLAAGSGGQLGGTLTATAASGVATFSGVTLTGLVGTAYTLRASASGLTSADAAGVSLTGPGPATQVTAAAGQAQSATIGTAVAVRPAVVVRDMTGNGVPGVAVTFAVGSGGGSVTGATTTTDATGVATVGSWRLGLAMGSNTLGATVSGLSGSPVTFAATAVAVVPAVPTSVQVGARNGALVVRWQAPAEAPGATPMAHVLQYRALPDGDWSGGAAFDAALRDARVNGLTNGTAYEVRLASENSGGRSAWSTPVQGRPYRIDLRVAEMRPLTATSYLLTLQWTYDGASPGDFVLEGGTADGQRSGILVGPVTLWRGSADAGRYTARVRLATDALGDNPSNEVQVTAQTTVAPATPTNLRANIEGNQVTLAWVQDLSAGVPRENYLVVEGVADPLRLGLGTSVTFGGVPDGRYAVRIAAVNEAGASALSAPVLVSVPGGCQAPQPPSWVSVGLENGVGLATWETATAGGAATDYLVTVEGVGVYATGGASRISGRLGPGEYRISVQARNACGVSAPSAVQVLRVP